MHHAPLRRRDLLQRGTGLALAFAVPALQAAPALSRAGRHSTVDVTEGPFFRDGQLRRADLRTDPSDGSTQPGLPLQLAIDVLALDTARGEARPLHGATVDLWQCNAAGRYAGVDAEGTAGRRFLRGWLPSDAHGRVQFTSIVPGAYPGRTPHLHCRVRGFDAADAQATLTTQFFFDEALLRRIYADADLPYRAHLDTRGPPVMRQADDPVFQGSDGCQPGHVAGEALLLKTVRESDRLRAHIEILIDTRLRCSSHEPRFGAGPVPGHGPGPFGRSPAAMWPGPPPGRGWQPGGIGGGPGGPPAAPPGRGPVMR